MQKKLITVPTHCAVCNALIFGKIFRCSACSISVERSCMEKLDSVCSKGDSKSKRKSSMPTGGKQRGESVSSSTPPLINEKSNSPAPKTSKSNEILTPSPIPTSTATNTTGQTKSNEVQIVRSFTVTSQSPTQERAFQGEKANIDKIAAQNKQTTTTNQNTPPLIQSKESRRESEEGIDTYEMRPSLNQARRGLPKLKRGDSEEEFDAYEKRKLENSAASTNSANTSATNNSGSQQLANSNTSNDSAQSQTSQTTPTSQHPQSIERQNSKINRSPALRNIKSNANLNAETSTQQNNNTLQKQNSKETLLKNSDEKQQQQTNNNNNNTSPTTQPQAIPPNLQKQSSKGALKNSNENNQSTSPTNTSTISSTSPNSQRPQLGKQSSKGALKSSPDKLSQSGKGVKQQQPQQQKTVLTPEEQERRKKRNQTFL